jgi:uncharacterized protein (DUF2235 family)
MSRNIIMCCDGTNNEFGPENTNVVRLSQLIERDPVKQRLYYDPGVGTLPEPSVWGAVSKRVSEWMGLAFGRGLTWKVEEAYSYLMDFWEPGDRVFLFGFSRGAYGVRVLAGVLHALGLLPKGNHNLVPYVMRLYAALRSERGAPAKWTDLCNQFRWSFARTVPEDPDERHFHVHYLGLWDTVSSVGWVWDPPKFPFTAWNPSVHAIRHAMSIDERRWFFRQNRMERVSPSQQLDQQWFAGVHSDVGGGYPESDGGLWREPFCWILEGAKQAGMLVDPTRAGEVLSATKPTGSPWNDPKHESLTKSWWPAEFLPKQQWREKQRRNVLAVGLGRNRVIDEGELIHRSALLRLRGLPEYRPRNLSEAFVRAVKEMSDVPDSVTYTKDGSRLSNEVLETHAVGR